MALLHPIAHRRHRLLRIRCLGGGRDFEQGGRQFARLLHAHPDRVHHRVAQGPRIFGATSCCHQHVGPPWPGSRCQLKSLQRMDDRSLLHLISPNGASFIIGLRTVSRRIRRRERVRPARRLPPASAWSGSFCTPWPLRWPHRDRGAFAIDHLFHFLPPALRRPVPPEDSHGGLIECGQNRGGVAW
jgi:hypothetical protein